MVEASEEGQGPRRAVEPMMMMMMIHQYTQHLGKYIYYVLININSSSGYLGTPEILPLLRGPRKRVREVAIPRYLS
jgi:hypothetical protein